MHAQLKFGTAVIANWIRDCSKSFIRWDFNPASEFARVLWSHVSNYFRNTSTIWTQIHFCFVTSCNLQNENVNKKLLNTRTIIKTQIRWWFANTKTIQIEKNILPYDQCISLPWICRALFQLEISTNRCLGHEWCDHDIAPNSCKYG